MLIKIILLAVITLLLGVLFLGIKYFGKTTYPRCNATGESNEHNLKSECELCEATPVHECAKNN